MLWRGSGRVARTPANPSGEGLARRSRAAPGSPRDSENQGEHDETQEETDGDEPGEADSEYEERPTDNE